MIRYLVIFLMLAAVGMGYSGSGTEGSPFLITNTTDWELYADTSADWAAGKYAYQTADITFGGAMSPIEGTFSGVYNGNGKVIVTPTVTPDSASNHTAIFENLNTGAVIKNMIIDTGVCTGSSAEADKSYTGMLVAEMVTGAVVQDCVLISCTVSNTHTAATFDGFVGMVAGANHGTVQRCKVVGGTVSGDITGGTNLLVGGVVAYQTYTGTTAGYVRECTSSATIDDVAVGSTITAKVGGIVGASLGGASAQGNIVDCTFTGNINYNSATTFWAGGIVGELNGPASGCVSTGTINVAVAVAAKSAWAGGIAGRSNYSAASITDCKVYSDITADGTAAARIGGLIATADEPITISDSYYSGNMTPISGSGGYVGSLVAFCTSGDNLVIDSCSSNFQIDAIFSGTEFVSGGIGYFETGTITNCIVQGGITTNGTTNLISIGYFGGMAAHLADTSVFESCVAVVGPWSSPNANRGGFGGGRTTAPTVTNCYWDTDVANHTTASDGTEATTAELQTGYVAGLPVSKWNQTSGEYPELSFGLQTYGTGGGSGGAMGTKNNALY